MIVTVTPNPSLDRTFEIAGLERGAVIRAEASRAEPGGKGVNVARALLANGHEVRAVLPIGGPEGGHLAGLLAAAGVVCRSVPVRAAVRTNVSLVEPDGAVTKVNAGGPPLSPEEIDALVTTAIDTLEGAVWLAACGSLPPGAPPRFYADLTTAVHEAGHRIAVDTSGAPLAAAVDAGPDVCKPNAEELAALLGRPLTTLGAVVDGAHELRSRGVGAVLVSLGRHGAVLVDDDGATHAHTPPRVPRSNVGAGDATLAGYLAAGGAGTDALRQAVAWGAAAVRLPGTAMPTPADIEPAEVRVEPVDPDRRLDP